MAIVTKGNEGNEPMADDDAASGGRGGGAGGGPESHEEPDREDRVPEARPAAAAAAPGQKRGFFRIYKPGQGYWTRMGTVVGVGLLIALISSFLYDQLVNYAELSIRTSLIIVGVFVVAVGLVAWHYLNKPTVVDFLVATESEMKKVNWTSRKELIGSTKVVVFFMFLVALVLFVYDLVFGWFFYGTGVLRTPPF